MRRVIRDMVVVVLVVWVVLATTLRRLVRGPKHPAWSYRFEIVAEVVRAVMELGHRHMDIELRRQMPTAPLPPALRGRLHWERGHIAGLPMEQHTPTGWRPGDPVWLHLHGGAYSMCSPATHRGLAAQIALRTGARCILPNYRKAPEHPYPAAIDDALGVYRALLDDGVPPETILLGGDSAGGGLALALMQRLRDGGLPQPRAAILLSPWVDLTARGGTIDDNRRYDYLSGEMLEWGVAAYLAGADAHDPLASPIYADLRGLPPMLVQSGGGEIFLGQNLAFVERARAAGVQVLHEVSDGMVHVFQVFGGAPAREALRSIAGFVKTPSAAPVAE